MVIPGLFFFPFVVLTVKSCTKFFDDWIWTQVLGYRKAIMSICKKFNEQMFITSGQLVEQLHLIPE